MKLVLCISVDVSWSAKSCGLCHVSLGLSPSTHLLSRSQTEFPSSGTRICLCTGCRTGSCSLLFSPLRSLALPSRPTPCSHTQNNGSGDAISSGLFVRVCDWAMSCDGCTRGRSTSRLTHHGHFERSGAAEDVLLVFAKFIVLWTAIVVAEVAVEARQRVCEDGENADKGERQHT